jgi:hypothetical protein
LRVCFMWKASFIKRIFLIWSNSISGLERPSVLGRGSYWKRVRHERHKKRNGGFHGSEHGQARV